MSRRAWLVTAAGLVAMQGAFIAVYLAVRSDRHVDRERFRFERLSGTEQAPSLALERPAGTRLSWPPARPEDRPVLVHFWASWCAPCRDELPVLLATARELDASIVAVSLDDAWAPIGTFFGGRVPPVVVRSVEAAGPRRYGVSTLPDTFVVGPDGSLAARYPGAQDWSSDAGRRHLQAIAGGRIPP